MRAEPTVTLQDERPVPGGRRLGLTIHTPDGDVPALLGLPDARGPVPGALLLHGFSQRGEVLANSAGAALLRRGVAFLATDLPMHGTRGNPLEMQAMRNPLALAGLWRAALRESARAVDVLGERPEVDASRLGLVGYSLGSFLGVVLAAQEPQIRAVVLAAGGDLPGGTPLTGVARAVADPLRAARGLRGRPLLMVHGRHDRVILPEQAERLYVAATEPKELRWWNADHALPAAAIEEAADWLAQQLGAGVPAART